MVKKQLAKLVSLKYRSTKNPYESELRSLRNIHKGKRCFIIGTGPSLNKTNIELLKDEICFGVNTLYKIKPDCKYWVLCDPALWAKKCVEFIKESDYEKLFLCEFIAYNYLKNYNFISSAHDSYIVKYLGSSKIFDSVSKDISKGTYSGSTVVLHAIQIAYYMGFSEIYLVGCDTDYSGIHHFDGSTCADIGDPNGANANCNYDETLYSYKLCKYHLEDGKCRIYNSTVGGKLEIFQRKKLEDVVKWKE